MKYMKQFSIIIITAFLGEVLHSVLPFSIPASVYGLVLMLAGLKSGVIRHTEVKETAGFLIEIMPVMFIPAGVGVITSWDELRAVLIPVLVTVVLTTVIVMVVTGRTTQFVIRRGQQLTAKEREEICRNF